MRNRTGKIVAELFRPSSAKSPRLRGFARDNPALQEIWHVVSAIPRGKASTYGEVARAAGLPGRARQVGFALRTAPDELCLPWHRVVGAGRRIVFPPQSRKHLEQARRLRGEGVRVARGRLPASAMLEM